ncbi:MAG: hypothetical protein ACLFR5_04370 [Halobacteriales archaeon]
MKHKRTDINRRTLLKLLGTTAAVGASGCVSRRPVEFEESGVRIDSGDYYSYHLDIQDAGPAEPEISYTVTGEPRDRFNVFVFAPDEFERYRRTIQGRSRSSLETEEGLSRSGVDDSRVSHTESMPEDEYEFVVDHTDVPSEMVGMDVNDRLDEPITVDIEITVDYPGIADRLPF